MFRTGSLDYIVHNLEQIYISDYVFKNELKDGSMEKNRIKKLINQDKVKILYFKDLTYAQKRLYLEAKKLLDSKTTEDYIDEGEKITACFANAHKVYYYMSDDNRAAPYIRSLTVVEVINYCDLLYISYRINEKDVRLLNDFYNKYINLFEEGHVPGNLIDNSGKAMKFATVMGICFDKFYKNERLTRYLELLISN